MILHTYACITRYYLYYAVKDIECTYVCLATFDPHLRLTGVFGVFEGIRELSPLKSLMNSTARGQRDAVSPA